MPKTWARTQVGYMRHPKFLALNGNAISLWHEGKDYCEEHHTDGLLPLVAVKHFRFSGKKSLDMLMASCGQKEDGSPYAPLWEPHPAGYRMHDYLDHNPCRDEVLARMARADEKREQDRERMQNWRERQKSQPMSRVTETKKSPVENRTEKKSLEEKEQDTGGETESVSPPPVPPILEFPTDGLPDRWGLSPAQLQEWQQAYPSLDVRTECTKALVWVKASGTHRKTASGMPRFLVNWLNRATNAPRAPVASTRRPTWAQ